MSDSAPPSAYISAVSMTVMPRSIASFSAAASVERRRRDSPMRQVPSPRLGTVTPDGKVALLPLTLLEQCGELAVPLLDELRGRDEPHRRRVHAEALAGRLRSIVEEVAEVRVGVRRAHLGALHEQRAVGLRLHVLRHERLREARPSGARV